MDDTILREDDIAEAVMRLWLYRAGGPTGMKAEHLQICHRAAYREEDFDLGNGEKLFALIQVSFMGGEN